MKVYFVAGEIPNNKKYYEIYDVVFGYPDSDEIGEYVEIMTGNLKGTTKEYINDRNIYGVIETNEKVLIEATNSEKIEDWQTHFKTANSGLVLHYIEKEKRYYIEKLTKQSWMELLESKFFDKKDLFLFRVFKDGIYNAKTIPNKVRK